MKNILFLRRNQNTIKKLIFCSLIMGLNTLNAMNSESPHDTMLGMIRRKEMDVFRQLTYKGANYTIAGYTIHEDSNKITYKLQRPVNVGPLNIGTDFVTVEDSLNDLEVSKHKELKEERVYNYASKCVGNGIYSTSVLAGSLTFLYGFIKCMNMVEKK